MIRKSLQLKIRSIFLDPPTGARRQDFFRRLETFLVTSRTLLLVADWNCILEVRKDCVGLVHSRRELQKPRKPAQKLPTF